VSIAGLGIKEITFDIVDCDFKGNKEGLLIFYKASPMNGITVLTIRDSAFAISEGNGLKISSNSSSDNQLHAEITDSNSLIIGATELLLRHQALTSVSSNSRALFLFLNSLSSISGCRFENHSSAEVVSIVGSAAVVFEKLLNEGEHGGPNCSVIHAKCAKKTSDIVVPIAQ
jgi:hypothetical protein